MKVSYTNTLEHICAACNGTLMYGEPHTVIKTIATDSRDTGEAMLFIPLAGERFDGHDFIEALARDKSIIAFLTMKDGFEAIAKQYGISSVRCDDSLAALGMIARDHRKNINPTVIGITGTNGKTTTKEITHAVISKKYTTLKNEKNYNNEIGVPFTLLGLTQEHAVAVVEMGMNHSGEISRLSKIVEPDIAIITNIGEGHLEFLGSVENVARAKAEIFDFMQPGRLAVLNADTACFDHVALKARQHSIQVKTFGMAPGADIRADDYQLAEHSTILTVKGTRYELPLYGIHNVYNALIAIAIAEELGIDKAAIQEALAGFCNVDGRSQVIDLGYIIINDTYNSNPLSSRMALQSIKEIYATRRKIAVLSDMKELGETAEFYHEQTGKVAAENGFDLLLLWGDMAGAYARGAHIQGMNKEQIILFSDKNELSDYLLGILTDRDVVLVKGSRSMKMEDVVISLRRGC